MYEDELTEITCYGRYAKASASAPIYEDGFEPQSANSALDRLSSRGKIFFDILTVAVILTVVFLCKKHQDYIVSVVNKKLNGTTR